MQSTKSLSRWVSGFQVEFQAFRAKLNEMDKKQTVMWHRECCLPGDLTVVAVGKYLPDERVVYEKQLQTPGRFSDGYIPLQAIHLFPGGNDEGIQWSLSQKRLRDLYGCIRSQWR